ncbi:hypothetical protein BDZ91DRAFT_745725 [Kalaharituber pfeilii]|nr:hypothetical protein BDZ91DRAFT_745725 [Kalaharituber pfeilii]
MEEVQQEACGNRRLVAVDELGIKTVLRGDVETVAGRVCSHAARPTYSVDMCSHMQSKAE